MKHRTAPPPVPANEWEARCRRCARCCHEKIEFEGRIYYTPDPCEFLDTATRLCTVYSERHRHKSACAPLTPAVLSMGALPADCPYVCDISDYPAPIPWEEEG